jgi:hypothetical protein
LPGAPASREIRVLVFLGLLYHLRLRYLKHQFNSRWKARLGEPYARSTLGIKTLPQAAFVAVLEVCPAGSVLDYVPIGSDPGLTDLLRFADDSGVSDYWPHLGNLPTRPLATVVISGIVTSTFLALLVLRSVYPWFMGTNDHPVE